ncbi:DNA binding protein, putative [Plasmodium ovale]|uniref:3'-5' exonuclease n=2 Tax=Plasmodium ovale TaxID=36330 RepID=A0A1A8VM10_PLAOA|nr:DNA binding protein, putative [Plasmodium ovale curtisi]SCA48245.1 DNA binding protein, putative [Plasmodium ovale]
MLKFVKRPFVTTLAVSLPNNKNPHLSSLTFSGNVIYVNNENVGKYGKNIIKYLKTDIIGFDTEFIFDVSKSRSILFKKEYILNDSKCLSNAKNGLNQNDESSMSQKNAATCLRKSNFILEKNENVKLRETQSTISCVHECKARDNRNWASSPFRIFQGKSRNRENGESITCKENKRLCLIQLSSDNICFVFNINSLKGEIPVAVKEILENDQILKVCHDFKNDEDMFLSSNIKIKNVFDLYNYSIENFIYPPSLQSLVKIYLRKHLNKNWRLSNWMNNHLKEEQILYAATDAYASREIYMILKRQNKISESTPLQLNIKRGAIYSKCVKKCEKNCVAQDKGGYGKSNTENISEGKVPECIMQQGEIHHCIESGQSFNETHRNEDIKSILQDGKKECVMGEEMGKVELTHAGRNDKQNYDFHEKTRKKSKSYQFLEMDKLHIINNLKDQINVICSKFNNIFFAEEMIFSSYSYKNLLYLKHAEKGNCLIKLYSHSYDEEIECCKQILNFIKMRIV